MAGVPEAVGVKGKQRASSKTISFPFRFLWRNILFYGKTLRNITQNFCIFRIKGKKIK